MQIIQWNAPMHKTNVILKKSYLYYVEVFITDHYGLHGFY